VILLFSFMLLRSAAEPLLRTQYDVVLASQPA
jgi:hypothetical protein